MEQLRTQFDSLISTKVTERKKSCDALHDLLKSKRVIQHLDDGTEGDDWDGIFSAAKRGLLRHLEKLKEELQKTGKQTAGSILQTQNCNDLLVLIMDIANRRDGVINYDSFINYLKMCLRDAFLKEYCLNRCLCALRESVIPKISYWSQITVEKWEELLKILKNLHKESIELKVVKCVSLLIKFGANHKIPLHCVQKEYPFVLEVCQSIKKTSPKWHQIDTLELFREFCSQNKHDNPLLVCSLGESVVNNLLQLYELYGKHLDVTLLAFTAILEQVKVHHPGGVYQSDSLSQAHSWTEWNQILNNIYGVLNEIISNRDNAIYGNDGSGYRMHPIFSELAVEIYRQVCENNKIVANEEGEPTPKKRRLDVGIKRITQDIETTKDWPWINLITELLKKYPKSICFDDYINLLQFLANYQSECRVSNTRGHISECLSVLLDVEAVLIKPLDFEENSLDSMWSLIRDSTFRSMGLNQNPIETHPLIRGLVERNKIHSALQPINAFVSKIITLTPDSLRTLDAIGRKFNIPETIGNLDDTPRNILLHWILNSNNTEIYADEICAKVLIYLTLKQWPNETNEKHTSVQAMTLEDIYGCRIIEKDLFKSDNLPDNHTVKQYVLHVEAFNKLMELLQTEVTDKVMLKKANKIADVLNTIFLYTNLLATFKIYEIDYGYEKVEGMLKKALPLLWEILLTIFQELNMRSYKHEELVFNGMIRLMELDDRAKCDLRSTVHVALIRRLFELLNNEEDEFDNIGKQDSEIANSTLKRKIRIVTFLCRYAIHTRNEVQRRAIQSLIENDFEPKKPTDYALAMVILNSLNERESAVPIDILQNAHVSLQRICKDRYTEHDTALDVINLINSFIPYIAASNDQNIQKLYVTLLKPFFQLRNDYGPEVSVAISNCMGEMTKVDPDCTWSYWQNKRDLILELPSFLKSDYLIVRLVTIKNLMIPFSQKDASTTDIFKIQNELFWKVSEMVENLFKEADKESSDVFTNNIATALYVYGAILVSNSVLRPNALFELLNISYLEKIPSEKLKAILTIVTKKLGISDPLEMLKNHLNVLLTKWHLKKYSIKDFPFTLFGCETDTEFYKNYTSFIIPILINEQNTSFFESVCSSIGKSAVEVIEVAYPKIEAKNFVLKSFSEASPSFKVTPKDIAISKNIKERIITYLPADKEEKILHDKIDEILMHIVEFVFDLQDFRTTFDVLYAIPVPDSTFLSVDIFMETLNLLRNKLLGESNVELFDYLVKEKPKKLQQLILKLNYNVYKATGVEDTLLAFHRYVIILVIIEPHFKNNNNLLIPFLIRDITYTLINIIKHDCDNDAAILNLLAAKYFARFVDVVLPECSEIFSDFLVLIASTLVPIANLDTKLGYLALGILRKLVIEHHDCLKNGLKVLDPFPEKARFAELYKVHFNMKYGANCQLKTKIKYFLRAGDSLKRDGCRTEGLKHLRKQLVNHKEELRLLYNELYEMRGSLDNESLLHRLICKLVELTSSSIKEESVEATRCLGELGPADLTTMVLKTEDNPENLNSSPINLFTYQVIDLLVEYIVDEDIDIILVASEALYELLNSPEGKIIYRQDNLKYKKYITLFSSKEKKSCGKINIKDGNFKDIIKDEALWCPLTKMEHSEWIVKLVSSILESFNNDCCYKTLISIVKIKVEFAEKLLPILTNVILDITNISFRIISQTISLFFKRHFDLHLLQNKDYKIIPMQKASVQCMLDTVNFVRLQRNVYKTIKHTNMLQLDLNYIHVALAAQFCSAHFSSIMYTELWCHSASSEILRTKTDLVGNEALLDIICENVEGNIEESKALHSILRKNFIDIGDKDNIHYNQLLDPLDELTQVNLYTDLNEWALLLQHYDVQSSHQETYDEQHWMNAMKNFGLLNHAVTSKDLKEPQYEFMWRLAKWDDVLPSSTNIDNFHQNNYLALKAFNDKDYSSFTEIINTARTNVTRTFQHGSLESCKNLYEPLMKLQCLQELEDVYSACANENFEDVVKSWEFKNLINQNEFKYFETILSHRICILKILLKRNHSNVIRDALINMQIELSALARSEGNWNVAKRALAEAMKIENLNENVRAKILLEDSQIYWNIDHNTGIRVLKRFLNNYKEDSIIRSEGLKLYGSWMVQRKSESSETIISEYFQESINILSKLRTSNSNTKIDIFYEPYDLLAGYADQEYQKISNYTKSSVFQGKVQNMEKLQKTAVTLKQQPNANSLDVKKAIAIASRQSSLDKTEIDNTLKEKEIYLNLALKYYLHNLQHSNKNNIRMFQIVSLWIENKGNAAISELMQKELPKIPSHKVLLVLPQLVPHISSNADGDSFATQINSLIERCAVQHPHHAIPIILSVANSNKDDVYTKGKTNTETNEFRIKGAQIIVQKLKAIPTLKNMVGQLDKVVDALIQLAYYDCGQDCNDEKPVAIPARFKIRAINNYTEVLLPTCSLPIKISANYNNIIGIYKFSDKFNLVGGVNAPKRIQCIGTDGIVRTQLVKGKDDLRQDAVMQQVFTIMNNLLACDKNTSNLLIRTYRILPLSKRSGILEWVDNTIPLGDYLVGSKKKPGAHHTFNIEDISPERCRLEFKDMAKDNNKTKLQKYKRMCTRFHPVLHKFFEQRFLQPTVWYERKRAFTHSVATTSMCGYILGLGDRHVNNILIDKNTGEVIHIDFGIAFEQGKVLPTPETVPFRLTRDIEAGMGINGVEGTFRRSCEKTLEVLRNNSTTILSILEVLLYDPLYEWTITPAQAYSRQLDIEDEPLDFNSNDSIEFNVTAERALTRLKEKLLGTETGGFSSIEGQVSALIQQARDPENLCKLFHGWQPYL